MNHVQTVTGPISPDTLGFCQMHEHLRVEAGPATRQYPALLIDDAEKSIREVGDYKNAGGQTILDAQPSGAGRNAGALQKISLAAKVNIVTVTGYHLPMFYEQDHWIHTEDEDALTARFLDELAHGCAEDRSVLPGAVKSALGKEGCEGRTEVKFRAAARAAAQWGTPLVIHTEKGAGAVKAVQIAQDAGVPSQRILVCHVDRQAEDYAIHDRVAATGAMLEYDTIGRFKYHDDESEIKLIQHMLEGGHGDQLLLSLDTTAQRLAAYGGSIGLCYLLETFLPMLRRSGVSEDWIRRFTVENPRRVFA